MHQIEKSLTYYTLYMSITPQLFHKVYMNRLSKLPEQFSSKAIFQYFVVLFNFIIKIGVQSNQFIQREYMGINGN